MASIMSPISNVLSKFVDIKRNIENDYTKSSSIRTRMVDAFCMYAAATAFIQLLYVVLVGSYPFNSFLSSFICHIGLFALGVSLRLQLTSPDFKSVSAERAYAEFSFCVLVLFFIVFSFMG